MGITGVIDRSATKHVQLWGMDAEVIASDEECGSDRLFYVLGTLAPGATSEVIQHDDCETAWYMLSGKTMCIIGDNETGDLQAIECGDGSAGYVATGEVHVQRNLSTTEPAQFLMAHVGINNAAAAAGTSVTPSAKLQELLAAPAQS